MEREDGKNPGDMDFQTPVEGEELKSGQSELKTIRTPMDSDDFLVREGNNKKLLKENVGVLAEPIVHQFLENLQGKKDANKIIEAITRGEKVEILVKLDNGTLITLDADRGTIGEALKRVGDTPEGQQVVEMLEQALDECLMELEGKILPRRNDYFTLEHTYPELQDLMNIAGYGDKVREKIVKFVEKLHGE